MSSCIEINWHIFMLILTNSVNEKLNRCIFNTKNILKDFTLKKILLVSCSNGYSMFIFLSSRNYCLAADNYNNY